MKKRDQFYQWLSSNPRKKHSADSIIAAFEDGSAYCRTHNICKESFWDMDEKSKFTSISSKLLSMRLYRITHRKTALILDKAVPLYKDFLEEKESQFTSEDSGRSDAHVNADKTGADVRMSEKRPVKLVYSNDDGKEIVAEKLSTITSILLQRYKDEPATSLSELIKNNKDIPVPYINGWTKRVENQTAAQYLIAKGIIKKNEDTRSEEEKRNERLNKLNEVTSILLSRCANMPVSSLAELIKQNPDLPVASLGVWSKEFFGQTASEYYRERGILLPLIEKNTEEKLQEAIIQIKTVLGDRHIHSLSEVDKCGLGITIPTLNNWARKQYGKTISEYLVEEGILEREDSEQINGQDSSAQHINKSNNPGLDDEDDEDTDDELIGAMELSLFRTAEYLKTRYDVQFLRNHLDSDEREVKMGVSNGQKVIMYLSCFLSMTDRFLCIETEPEYLKDIVAFDGFTRIQKQASHPRQKLFFEDYGAIRETLISICDSIDRFFSTGIPTQSQPDRVKLDHKLYCILQVYDDPAGISLARIMSIIGENVDEHVVKDILNEASWAFKRSENTYSFSKKETPTASEPVEENDSTTDQGISELTFYEYLRGELGMAESTCRSYVSAIRTAEGYAISKSISPHELFGRNTFEATQLIQFLLNDSKFLKLNSSEHNRFSAAFAKFTALAKRVSDHRTGQSAQDSKSEPTDFEKEKYVQILLSRYRNGMMFDSIDFDIFRETYERLFGEQLTFDDSALEARLRNCGILYKDRLFPADGIIDPETRKKLFEYIDGCFASGKTVLYYKAIFADLASELASCYTLADEEMLRAYIEFTAEKGKYYFTEKYLSAEKDVVVDHNAEVADYLLSAGKPMTIDAIASALSHIPQEQVQNIIYFDNRFLRNSKGEFFHKDIFEVSEDDLEAIADIINSYIDENEYAIWTDVWNQIKEKIPVFLENNLYLSWLGIRNAVAPYFSGRFNFNASVISAPEKHYEMKDIFQLYAKHHPTFSADDIYALSKELDTPLNIYLWALAEVSVRVSYDLFVSKGQIAFDIEAVDKAIGSFMAKDYICLREIDSFLAFPNVDYEWNTYLLESYVLSFSKKFKLLNNGLAFNNAPGAIVKRDGAYTEFVDVCAALLADSHIELKKDAALNYLADRNMITQKRYKNIELAIQKAGQIRARKR